MVAVHRYEPHWPDELRLTLGDVVLVLSKHEEGRWFGRLQDGQRGYFPASCVMELNQAKKQITSHRRTVSLRSTVSDDAGVRRRHQTGHVQHALRRGNRAGGSALDWGQSDSEGPVSATHSQRSPSLLHRILSKCRRKSQCQGATNRAFEDD
ncbi:uncharacterized protein LOC117388621 [Periophthalmus magnuspinnatus]|uniref:uncharacterized protein LOC117388621 n=1 Tax=Periophthalmus magnuspinnatus TaxID=409849 RepID=UPI002436972F|nr:uncharacterized protein LOC117388621 [Periophthalmus magnuspinnatus]